MNIEQLLLLTFTFAICIKSPSSVCIEIFGFARIISKTVWILSTVLSDTFPSRFDNNALPDRNTWLTEPPIAKIQEIRFHLFVCRVAVESNSIERSKLMHHIHIQSEHGNSQSYSDNDDDVHPLASLDLNHFLKDCTCATHASIVRSHSHFSSMQIHRFSFHSISSIRLHCCTCNWSRIIYCDNEDDDDRIRDSTTRTHTLTSEGKKNENKEFFALEQSMTFDVNQYYWLNLSSMFHLHNFVALRNVSVHFASTIRANANTFSRSISFLFPLLWFSVRSKCSMK